MNAPVKLGELQNAEVQKEHHAMAKAAQTSIGFNTQASFELMQRAANLLGASTLVPKQYQGNIPNCVIALNMAERIGADPLMVMQNLYVVHGNPGWSSQFLIATFNQCGRFSAIRFEFFGKKDTDGWGCRAWAIEKSTEEKIIGADITIAMAKAEGWYQKNGSKWQTMPQQMLMYRAAAWMIRTHAPEIAMGLQTTDELHDVYDAEKVGDTYVTADSLRTVADTVDENEVVVEEKPESVDTTTGEVTQASAEEEPPAFDEEDMAGMTVE